MESPRRLLILLATLTACATSPLGRKQLMLVPQSQMDQMGAQAFQQVSQKTPADPDPTKNAFVHCVTGPLTALASQQLKVPNWDVVVFKSDEVNAFALPGGHIGVYDGIFKAAKTDGQLATVLAHEIGHVIARHGQERVSQDTVIQGAESATGALLIGPNNPNSNLLMGAPGLAGTVGLQLPFSRTQESEADLIGLDLMARAGFDPHQAIDLWNNMLAQSQGEPPAFLSDHPATKDRIVALNDHLPEAMTKFTQAQAQGLAPHCDSAGVIP